ncbi:F-box LRR-repeat 23 [Olea europaea subsp. europaea]|uniref:F-box LRR-repeat 23 n=1 Tax=Olea europaea subsp. europaea TaxID=158383 RepID=A0A8S0V354_OLEEU|nr:F-box LRR-repeat 23 [Olea europaea subsp. europaea]CAA3025779.1 F-box LRR-repeat 23 [Olea europaea subsp. europaea]
MGKKNQKKKLKLKKLKNKKKKAKAASSAPPPPSPPPPPPWLELPREVTADILQRLGIFDILESAQNVCTTWRNVCKDPSMWRVIDMKNLGRYHLFSYLDTRCRLAVDRSEGQLTEIYIDYFATDELLQYISERSSQLRCLRLGGCSEVSGDGLSEAAKGFPLLEELHFVFVKNCNEGIEAIGRSCPKLRSFTLSESGYKHPQLLCDADALAIAKSMPGLHRLQLLGNNMTNEGLQAILDGCPLLELLDIRKCLNVDLSGELGKRITQKIKDFKRPDDSMEDCEWDPEIFDCDEYDEDYYRSSEISEFSLDNYYDYDDYLHYSGSDYDSDGGVDPYFYFD